jgi:hypothetical protein
MIYIGLLNNEIKLSGSDAEAVKDGAFALGISLDSIEATNKEIVTAWDGKMYFAGEEPEKPTPTYEEVRQTREALYRDQKDPITCQIQSLRDEEETEEILAEIEALKVKRAEIVAKIKEENPYPTEESY